MLCECGCGETAKKGNRYIFNHHFSGRHHSIKTRKILSEIMKGRYVGEKNPMFGKSGTFTGRHHSTETKKKIGVFHKGKHISTEQKKKMSEARKGRFTSENNPMFGRIRNHSSDARKKISETTKANWQNPEYRNKLSGENSHSWLGGISFIPYAPEFNNHLKNQIKERDNHICQNCGSVQKLCIHHIDYNKKNSSPSNLITVCRVCHLRTNFDRFFWLIYFSQLMEVA